MTDGPDAALVVLAGSYAPADRPGIRAFRLDVAAGRMTEIGAWSGVEHPSFLVLSPDGRRLYAVSETGKSGSGGRVHAFDVDWAGGAPQLLAVGDVPSGGDHPCHLGLDPAGRWLAVANYGSGDVAVLDLDAAGGLGGVRASLSFRGGSVHPERQTAPHAHSATPTPDGQHLLVADLGGDRFVSVEVGADTLARRGEAEVRPGAGPRHAVVRPDGRLVVVANELDSTVSTYTLDVDGRLHHRTTVATVPDDAPHNQVAEVCATSDFRRVLVSNRGHDSIAVFDLDAAGGLINRSLRSCAGAWPRHFTVLPDDEHLVIANERSDELVLVGIDDTELVARASMPSPTCVVVRAPVAG